MNTRLVRLGEDLAAVQAGHVDQDLPDARWRGAVERSRGRRERRRRGRARRVQERARGVRGEAAEHRDDDGGRLATRDGWMKRRRLATRLSDSYRSPDSRSRSRADRIGAVALAADRFTVHVHRAFSQSTKERVRRRLISRSFFALFSHPFFRRKARRTIRQKPAKSLPKVSRGSSFTRGAEPAPPRAPPRAAAAACRRAATPPRRRAPATPSSSDRGQTSWAADTRARTKRSCARSAALSTTTSTTRVSRARPSARRARSRRRGRRGSAAASRA